MIERFQKTVMNYEKRGGRAVNESIYAGNLSILRIAAFDRVTVTVGGAVEEMPNKSGDYVIAADSQIYPGKNNYRNAAYIDGRRVG